ncbi:MAG: hypothetical protein ABR571_17515 [Jatrophihabitans sp.]|uniref:hypothetical protein n=1 Tax=Jatrophihabitans sp. TaxID=1932789 RepID=UPI00390E74B0
MTSRVLWKIVLYHDARDGRPIDGRLIGQDGNVVEFQGWLEFAAAIEGARSRHRTDTAAETPDPTNVARPSE